VSTAGAQRVVIERATESDGAEVFVISDEESEFARASRISDALHYASDLLYGPGTGPRGTVWNLLSAMEEPDWGQPSGTDRGSPEPWTVSVYGAIWRARRRPRRW
jgi:hypothetical protein